MLLGETIGKTKTSQTIKKQKINKNNFRIKEKTKRHVRKLSQVSTKVGKHRMILH